MKYLGIDYGSKRIGTAVSNAEGTIAFPRVTVQNGASAVAEIAALIAAENAETVVVGDTRTLEGGENPVTKQAEDFAARLGQVAQLPVVWAREAGSTMGVSDTQSAHNDSAAAAFILQRYLDMHTRSVE